MQTCIDNNSCESTCEQHCASSVENKCACDRGYYLASDHISCIGKCMYQVYVPVQLYMHTFWMYINSNFTPHNNYYYADINECLIPNFDGCVHASCNNTLGSFMCVCGLGFVSDGENNCIGNGVSFSAFGCFNN